MDTRNNVTDDDRRLVRLRDLKGFEVADGDHDIRGWKVKTPDGNTIGKVEELIVDPAERRVRYMEVKADRKALGIDHDRHILLPVGAVRLEDEGNDVLVERLPAGGLAGAPPYGGGDPITREYETALRQYYGSTGAGADADYYRDDLYSDSGLRRRTAADSVSTGGLPRLGDNEVTVPLTGDQELIVRQPGSDQEIVIRKNTADIDEVRG